MTIAAGGETARAELSVRAWRDTASGFLCLGAATALLPVAYLFSSIGVAVAGLVALLVAQICAWSRDAAVARTADDAAPRPAGRALFVAVTLLLGAAAGALFWSPPGGDPETAGVSRAVDGAMLGALVTGTAAILYVTLSMLRHAIAGAFHAGSVRRRPGPHLSLPRSVSRWSAASLAAGGVAAGLGGAAFVLTSEPLRIFAAAALLMAFVFAWGARGAAVREGGPRYFDR